MYYTYDRNTPNVPVNINLSADVLANSRNLLSRPNPNTQLPDFVATASCGAADGYPGTGINLPRPSSGSFAVTMSVAGRAESVLGVVPNPADTYITFTYDLPPGTIGELWVRDVLGRLVRRTGLLANAHSLTLPTYDLPAGVYVCSVAVNGAALRSQKVLIQH